MLRRLYSPVISVKLTDAMKHFTTIPVKKTYEIDYNGLNLFIDKQSCLKTF